MDYEKKYKQALERAKKEWVENLDNCYTNYRERLEIIFPELSEGEDERIRKAILELVKQSSEILSKQNQNNMIAWLEKQGEKKFIDDLTQQEAMDIAVAKCFEQGEQKPTDKVESKFKVGDKVHCGDENQPVTIIDITNDSYITDSMIGSILFSEEDDWTKIEQNCTWCEDDEEILKWLCRIIHSQRISKEITPKEESELGEWMDKWLNYNPQTKQGNKLDPDKVIEWLTANIRLYASLNSLYGSNCPQGDIEVESLLKAFKQAMKGGEQ